MDKWHPEAYQQGVRARLDGKTLRANLHPAGWMQDSFAAGWNDIDNDPAAPKETLETDVLTQNIARLLYDHSAKITPAEYNELFDLVWDNYQDLIIGG